MAVWSRLHCDVGLVVRRDGGAARAGLGADPEALGGGLHRDQGGARVDDDGKPLAPARRYRVVTTDFLFHGGDGYTFYRLDHAPQMTGTSWRKPVVEWTRGAKSDRQHPLEGVLPARGPSVRKGRE